MRIHSPWRPGPGLDATLSLARLPCRTPADLVALRAPGVLGERLAELGLVPGTELSVLQRAPFGGPLCLRVRGATLCLRRQDAAYVEVRARPPTAG